MRHVRSLFALSVLAMLVLVAGTASAQPFLSYLSNGSGHSYIQLPNSSSLDFSGGSFTFEAWVAVTDDGGCSSIAGNGYTASTWIGVCGTSLRSYVRGSASAFTMGTVPASDWTHIAVTFDNATKKRSHYIDGELVGERTETGPITPSESAWRLYSDANWQFTPSGAMDEVRFWNVARTKAQIRSTITKEIDAPTAGLVAVYELDGDATDAIGSLHGTKQGAAAYLVGPVTTGCTSTANMLCVGPSGRFGITATYKTNSSSGAAKVVPFQTSESGIFTFFSDTNWEMMVKVLNGCGINTKWWVFTSGITDQHVELVVTDRLSGRTQRYFNYSGEPFNAVTDVTAFPCP